MTGYEALLALLPDLHACTSVDEVARVLTARLAEVIRADLVTLNLISTREGEMTTIGMFDQDWADPREIEPFFDRYAHQHPLIQVFTSGAPRAPLRMSDHTDMEAFQQTELYRFCFVPLRSLHQIGLAVLAIPGTIIGIGINRTTEDFTDAELELATVLWRQLPDVVEHVNLRALHAEAAAIEGLRA